MECRIILVDDHSLFRNGLRELLERCEGCRVVGEAASGEEFLAMMEGMEADIVFMDFSMPGLDGAQTTERALARRPELRIITLTGRMRTRDDAADDQLSSREREILVAVCRGLSNQEIADELFISKRTVDKHRANILEKTGCKNTASLVVYAIRNGIVEI